MSKIETHSSAAYLGPRGTYTHTALLKYFGSEQVCEPQTEIRDVFTSVESGQNHFGVVPVENSTEGSINQTLDCISNSSLLVCGEILLRIHHCLITPSSTNAETVTKIVSHQQSLGQCREWLELHFPAVETVAVSSNAEAARIAKAEEGIAAIASKTAAEIYGLEVLAENIEDTVDNTTRFWVLSQGQQQELNSDSGNRTSEQKDRRNNDSTDTDTYKTSIIISTHNAPGTLFKVLEPFHRYGLNLSKLESRPSRKEAWSYSFFVDFEGHVGEENVQSVLTELKQHSLGVKFLGSYLSVT